MNHVSFKNRMIELVVDYLVIICYLIILLLVNLALTMVIWGGVPEYTELQVQLIATFTSVIPIILIFSYLDFYKNGSIGKRVAGLTLIFTHKKFRFSLLRNIIKFLPWQLGHFGVIHGMYHEFNMTSITIANLGMVLGLVLLLMGLFKKDKRHIGDMIAGTQVRVIK